MSFTTPLAKLLKRSPFKGMQDHMRVVVECAGQVLPLLEALCAGDEPGVAAANERIIELEAEADAIKNRLRAHLPKSLFLPVDRRDLLEILQIQDSIADAAQDIAGLLTMRPMEVPEPFKEPLIALVRRCIAVCEHDARIIETLDELLETGFRGREATRVEAMLDQLNELEDETDELGMALTRILFRHEDDLKPVSVILWYDLIEWIGDLADNAEKAGNRLRLLIAR